MYEFLKQFDTFDKPVEALYSGKLNLGTDLARAIQFLESYDHVITHTKSLNSGGILSRRGDASFLERLERQRDALAIHIGQLEEMINREDCRETPYFIPKRPSDWVVKGDEVVCFVYDEDSGETGNWFSGSVKAFKGEEKNTVLVSFGSDLEMLFELSTPFILKQWEYEYLAKSGDTPYAAVWCSYVPEATDGKMTANDFSLCLRLD